MGCGHSKVSRVGRADPDREAPRYGEPVVSA